MILFSLNIFDTFTYHHNKISKSPKKSMKVYYMIHSIYYTFLIYVNANLQNNVYSKNSSMTMTHEQWDTYIIPLLLS